MLKRETFPVSMLSDLTTSVVVCTERGDVHFGHLWKEACGTLFFLFGLFGVI